jgi:2-oxoglutarate dehydrogenase E1 component
MIVFTPKSMLRNRQAVSMPADFTEGSWKPILADPTITDSSKVTSVLLCSGKLRWDLVSRRSQEGKDGQVAILGVERLYPLPAKQLATHLGRFDNVTEVRWVQTNRPTRAPGRSWP